MKDNRFHSSLILFLAFLAASCTRMEELDIINTEYISFAYSQDALSATGSVETKAMDNEITCDITDWEYVGDESETETETKAKLTETLSGYAGVFGYNFATWDPSTVKPTVMYNMKNAIESGTLTPESKVLWKTYNTGSLRFYAYAPYGKFTLSDKETAGAPYLSYTVPTTNKDQIDILYAKSADVSCENREPVPLQFNHAMTAVQFRLGIDGATLKNVTISGVYKTGTFSLDGTWSNLANTGSFSVAHKDSLLIMVPQTVPEGAEISLTYNDGTKDNTIKASIAGQVWPAGKKVVYTLKKKKTDDNDEYIYLDLGLGNVNLTAGGYSGYVSVNGTRTEVKGTHNDSNKYYIYQSIFDQAPEKDHNVDDVRYTNTGYASEADFNAKKNCRVPQYKSDIMYFSPSKKGVTCPDWGKFITNNQSPHDVRLMWDNGDQNYSTTNVINICGPETGSSVFDVTIDRVFSRIAELNKGSLNIGHDGSGFKYYFTEKVTLRLKNNNALNRIHYRKPLSCTTDGYLKITSADGDGIAKGTLTVTMSKMTETEGPTNLLVYSLIGPGRDADGTDYEDERGKEGRQMKDLYFDGGIVYVGTQKYLSSHWNDNKPLLGVIGGVNSWAEITINGGILTAVSNGSSPAIGGGGGWESTGGKGVVTINGGTVYAYSFGVLGTFDSKETVVIPPAIGGGGTLGEWDDKGTFHPANAGPCDVTINGGNVYAYAVGGPAIGGGSCGRHAAGYCKFTMKEGKVVAQSLAGTIGGMDVSATNAIGGGRSGLIDGDGGKATLTLEGGNLQTGSVGGGTVDSRNLTGKIGSADITIKGGETNAQFIMAKGAGTAPTFKMEGGVIRNSTTTGGEFAKVQLNGGAVYMEEGTCSIENGTISNCSASLGGAVYMNGGTFNMSGGTIKTCNASTNGGAVYIEGGNVNLSGTGVIDHNIASKGDGGGVFIKGGNFTMTGGSITYNTADANPDGFTEGNGGGIYVSSISNNVSVSITGGSVKNNDADRNGGGLCVDMDGAKPGVTANIVIGTVGGKASTPDISLNSATLSGGGMDVQGSGSRITINSGTVKGNVSTYVKNEDIRNDGGIVDLVGKGTEVDVNYKTIHFYANNGSDPEPSDEQRVITSTNSPLRPTAKALAFEKEFFYLDSWNTKRDGTGKSYDLNGTGVTMNITEDVSLYGQWVAYQ